MDDCEINESPLAGRFCFGWRLLGRQANEIRTPKSFREKSAEMIDTKDIASL